MSAYVEQVCGVGGQQLGKGVGYKAEGAKDRPFLSPLPLTSSGHPTRCTQPPEPQMDILSATATVWETLLFSARLRNPSTVTADQLET